MKGKGKIICSKCLFISLTLNYMPVIGNRFFFLFYFLKISPEVMEKKLVIQSNKLEEKKPWLMKSMYNLPKWELNSSGSVPYL